MNRSAILFIAVCVVAVCLAFTTAGDAEACCCCKEHSGGGQAHQQPLTAYPVYVRTPWYPGKNVLRGLQAAFTPYGVAPRYSYGYYAPAY